MPLGYFEIGEFTYTLEQTEVDGAVEMPTVVSLIDPTKARIDGGLIGSIQQLHTDEPELLLYDWVGEADRGRIEEWRSDLLKTAVAYWRERYEPADFTEPAFTAVPDRAPWLGTDAYSLFVVSLFNLALWLSVGIWLVPVGTPRLIPAAVGTLVAIAILFTANLIVHRNARRALRNSWPLAVSLLVTLTVIAAWIWSGTFPGGAYS